MHLFTTCRAISIYKLQLSHVHRIPRSVQLSIESSTWTQISFTILYNKCAHSSTVTSSICCPCLYIFQIFSSEFCTHLHAYLYNVSIHNPMTIPWHASTQHEFPFNFLFNSQWTYDLDFRTNFLHSFGQVSTQTSLQHSAAAERPAGHLQAMPELSIQVIPAWPWREDFGQHCI